MTIMATKPSGTSRNKAGGAAAGVLGAIAGLIPTATKPKSGKPTKWELPLTPEAKEDAIRWISAKAVYEVVESRLDHSKDAFIEYALDILAQKLFDNKTKASNPLVVIYDEDKKVDHQFQVTMTDKFKYRFPEVPEDVEPRDHFIEIFTNLGLHPNDATRLVDEELDFNPITGFKTLTELLEGSYGAGREWIEASDENKTAGAKFAALLLWDGTGDQPEPLTPEEKQLVIQRSPGMTVKQGFYDRVATYCQNKTQLLAIFKVIQPIIYPASPKFAESSTLTERTKRKIEAAADILGTETAESDD
jgi:hypothetical protein